jgi:hypothetical protein
VFVLTALGRRVVDVLPSQLSDRVGLYIAPLLGLACIVLFSTLYGWLSPFTTSYSLALVAVILILSFRFEKNWKELIRNWLFVSAFVLLASFPILASAIRFNAFNPFNDSFTYLVHAQWLQEHAFYETARASGFFPAETVMLCDSLLMDIQPAHLQLHSGRKLSPEERDSIRAEIVRSRLHSLESPDIRISTKDEKNPSDSPNPGDA